MKRKNIEVLLLSLSFVSCSSLEYGQVQKIEVDLMTVHAVLTVPKPIKIHREQYEEGVVYALSFLKGEVILVCEGSLMQFSVDQYKTLQMKKTVMLLLQKERMGKSVGEMMHILSLKYVMITYQDEIKKCLMRF